MVKGNFIKSSCLILRVIGDVNLTPEDDGSSNAYSYIFK